jgi:hypothetical protein
VRNAAHEACSREARDVADDTAAEGDEGGAAIGLLSEQRIEDRVEGVPSLGFLAVGRLRRETLWNRLPSATRARSPRSGPTTSFVTSRARWARGRAANTPGSSSRLLPITTS